MCTAARTGTCPGHRDLHLLPRSHQGLPLRDYLYVWCQQKASAWRSAWQRRLTRVGIASEGVGLRSQGHRLIMCWRCDGGIDVELIDDELWPVPPACKHTCLTHIHSVSVSHCADTVLASIVGAGIFKANSRPQEECAITVRRPDVALINRVTQVSLYTGRHLQQIPLKQLPTQDIQTGVSST